MDGVEITSVSCINFLPRQAALHCNGEEVGRGSVQEAYTCAMPMFPVPYVLFLRAIDAHAEHPSARKEN
jgi:hypothetical protein